ncbi:MAG: 50S ribosomal protein L44e [Candidatus Bathyarchaeota archaeon]|jgi:large subunit ribosomal protein L44e|nr:MAG: 50S ribosomal protein L44 [miscellaneous Crenarchaeota group archaeon SMTZ-80]MCW3975856.1 50S ribosomal protein L44e [Candidatus Bathyarchaeota archaeon]MCZ2845190.1 50S ribosomal protein L44e [Candidatus Bathyarchaeota archaeon]
MRIAKEINTNCPKCRHHTVHSVSLYKKRKERSLAAGVRRHEREKHGYGGQKWPELKRTAKTTKKQVIMLKCKDCGYIIPRLNKRLSKLEIGVQSI